MAKTKGQGKGKIDAPLRTVNKKADLKAAIKALPDNKTHAWHEIIGGGGTYHSGTGLSLVEGEFHYLPLKKANANKLFKRVATPLDTDKEGK